MKIHNTPAIRFLVSRLLWATGLSRILTIRANGYRLRFYPTSISTAMWCDPGFYRQDEAVLQQLLRPGDYFVDVGANIGALTLVASNLVGASGRVFAIEAHPKTVEYLSANIRLNKVNNVQVIHAAVGDRHAEAHITDQRSDDQNSVSTEGFGELRVPLRTLDSLLPDMHVRVLKIDVEGFELFVLRGSSRILERTDFVYFESWERHFSKFGYGTQEVISLLKKQGFSVNREEEYVSTKIENLLAVKAGSG